jgi:sec-independent protein translocase protein TatA
MPIGVHELLLILLIVLILFGAKKIPELAKGLGIGIREFRKASKGLEDDNIKQQVNGQEEESSKVDDKNS